MKEKTKEKDNKKMPHHLMFEARVRGPTIPAVIGPTVHPHCTHCSSSPGIPCLCCSLLLLFVICYHSPSLSMVLLLSLSQCCAPPLSSSPPFLVCCVTCIRVSLLSRNGACCNPVSRHSQWQQSRQGTERGWGVFLQEVGG